MYSSPIIKTFSRLVRASSPLVTTGPRRRVILIERHSIYRQHIPYILLSRSLVKHHDARALLFHVNRQVAPSRLPLFLRRAIARRGPYRSIHRLFRSCGIRGSLQIDLYAEKYLGIATTVVEREIAGLSHSGLERFEVLGVTVGDLLYDDFLAHGHIAVDTSSPAFLTHSAQFIATVLAWHSFFKHYDVRAVVANHVYRQGVPARIANHLGIATYEAGLTRIARITKDSPALSESSRFREIFSDLSERQRAEALQLAGHEIDRYQSGARVDYTNWHLPSRRATASDLAQIESHSGKKVLLALHCLSDSPHVRGPSIYPDYSSWIQHTLQAARGTNVLIVLKPHPACPEPEKIESLLGEHANYLVVDARNSLQDLARAGVSQVVTFYGNISFEAALLGLEVVNLTYRNPHQNYSFGTVPISKVDYLEKLTSAQTSAMEYHTDELREYFYMSRLHWNENIIFSQTHEVSSAAEKNAKPAECLLNKFVSEFETTDLRKLEDLLLEFVASEEPRFHRPR